MAAPKGNKYAKGRPQGVMNPDKARFKEALAELFERSADDMLVWLGEIEKPKERFDILSNFAEFLYPKLSRATTDLKVEGTMTFVLPVNAVPNSARN